MQPTGKNILKSLRLSIIISSIISILPALGFIVLNLVPPPLVTDIWILLMGAAGKFLIFFVFLTPTIWLVAFALRQRQAGL